MKRLKRLFGIGPSDRERRRRESRQTIGNSEGNRHSSAPTTPRGPATPRGRLSWANGRARGSNTPQASDNTSDGPNRRPTQQEIDDEAYARQLQAEEERNAFGGVFGVRPGAPGGLRNAGPDTTSDPSHIPGLIPADAMFRLIFGPPPTATGEMSSSSSSRRSQAAARASARGPLFGGPRAAPAPRGWATTRRSRGGSESGSQAPAIRIRLQPQSAENRTGPTEDDFRNLLNALMSRGFFEELMLGPLAAQLRGMAPPDRGATKEQINKLKSRKYNPKAATDDSQTSCVICLSDFTKNCSVTDMKCKHVFHSSCLVDWLKVNGSCPVCKADMDGKPAES